MTNSKFVLQTADNLLLILQEAPRTIKSLADLTGINYYSVRKAVLHLQEMGLVKPTAVSQHRNVEYTATDNSGPNRIIPIIRTSSGDHKLHVIASTHNNPRPAAAMAVLNLPRDITRLLSTAERLNKGLLVTTSLDNIRHEMETSLKSLRNAVSIYEQILTNSRIWNTETLSKFPNDVEYDEDLVKTAHDFYFTEE